MDIRVEKFALSQAGKPGVHGGDQRAFRIAGIAANTFQIRQGNTVEAFHGQNPASAAVLKHPWHRRIFVMSVVQEIPEHLQVVGFLDEVTLFHHRPLDFLHNTGHGSPGQFRRQGFKNAGRQIQKVQIRQQNVLHPRLLDLYHHFFTGHQSGGVNLGNRGRRQRHRINFRIDFIQRSTQFIPDDLLDHTKGQVRGLIEAVLEFLHILLGEKRGRAGNKLSQLDVGRTQ